MVIRRRKPKMAIPDTPLPLTHDGPLTRWQIEQLSVYNAERGRGIMHHPDYRKMMDDYQRRFDEVYLADVSTFGEPPGTKFVVAEKPAPKSSKI